LEKSFRAQWTIKQQRKWRAEKEASIQETLPISQEKQSKTFTIKQKIALAEV
jgi:hypothetical protein